MGSVPLNLLLKKICCLNVLSLHVRQVATRSVCVPVSVPMKMLSARLIVSPTVMISRGRKANVTRSWLACQDFYLNVYSENVLCRSVLIT